MKVSIGICAHDEEKNIGRLLTTLLNDEKLFIDEIIVVASGCTDGTEDIVKDYIKKLKKDKQKTKIILISQKVRLGKASAINLFLRRATCKILILESADTIPKNGTLQKLIKPFEDKKIGMTGARPMPLNDRNTFVGFMVQMIWKLHHNISLTDPKMGELIAIRNIVHSIPTNTAVDEVSLEHIIKSQGYKLKYVNDAIVFNSGPLTIRDLIKQRKRIYLGHRNVKKNTGYSPATQNLKKVIQESFKLFAKEKRKMWVILAIGLDVFVRVWAFFEYYIFKSNPYIWKIAKTTKKL